MGNATSPGLVLTREQCRAVDRYAIEELGIPGAVLMENAGRNAADLIARWLRLRRPRGSGPSKVCVVCGKGNNGGDGFVIARHLAGRGYPVAVDLYGEVGDLRGDAALNHAIVEKMGLPVRSCLLERGLLVQAARRWQRADVVVDALLGTGFAGSVRAPLDEVIVRLNALGARPKALHPHRQDGDATPVKGGWRQGPLVVSIDLPSGLDADQPGPEGVAVRADRTITFLARKPCMLARAGRAYCGRISVVDIGAPLALILKRLGVKI